MTSKKRTGGSVVSLTPEDVVAAREKLVAELMALRSVYNSAKRYLIFNGLDPERAADEMDMLVDAIQQVDNINHNWGD